MGVWFPFSRIIFVIGIFAAERLYGIIIKLLFLITWLYNFENGRQTGLCQSVSMFASTLKCWYFVSWFSCFLFLSFTVSCVCTGHFELLYWSLLFIFKTQLFTQRKRHLVLQTPLSPNCISVFVLKKKFCSLLCSNVHFHHFQSNYRCFGIKHFLQNLCYISVSVRKCFESFLGL